MSVIRILPEAVSNRIAAGEVVERPASIVKELMENSLDAGAKRVSVQIQRGGRALVRVIDDGCGMDREDALLCLEAHATSKVRNTEDIENIRTLGFRGEALPSIASVSRFSMQTRTADQDVGSEVIADGGDISQTGEAGCAPGTTITVRNLFYNMPARRKFLRAVRTEEQHIEEIVLLLALAHPEVAFQLSFDSRQVIDVQSSTDLRTRATMLLGSDTVDVMLPVEHREFGIHVYGLLARPGLTRSSRREQRVFVNGRPVQAAPVYLALRDAYHTMVGKGRYPPVVLFISLDPDQVDINVHPAKREVRFFNDRLIAQVVGAAARRSLRSVLAPDTFSAGPLPAAGPASMPMPAAPPVATPQLPMIPRAEPAASPVPSAPPPPSPSSIPAPMPPMPITPQLSPPAAPMAIPNAANSANELDALRVIGRLGHSLLLAEGDNGLVIIDQRAAHERVMFERILHMARQKDGVSQGLLIPLTLDLSAADARTLREHQESLGGLGLEMEAFGGNTFILTAVPAHFPQDDLAGLLRDILEDLRENGNSRRGDERQLARSACRAAVKARESLSDEEVTQLLADLVETEMPYSCPAGRPTMINISYRELERRFGRKY
jgi:DNA mismatch repair protein MutL